MDISDSYKNVPLVVDLDGTILYSDSLYESLAKLLIKKPYFIFSLFLWLFKGRADFKNKISQNIQLTYENLPYNENLINYLKEEKAKGRSIVLATGACKKIAKNIHKNIKIFDEVFYTNKVNLTGKNKAKLLIENFGKNKFDYIGNSYDDIHIWTHARYSHIVNASPKVLKKLLEVVDSNYVDTTLLEKRTFFSTLKEYLQAMRIHQWVKNLLIFLPLILSQSFSSIDNIINSFIAFTSFSFCASSVYLLNDLVDLDNDRVHRYKRYRPFASGRVNHILGLILALILLVLSFIIANYVGLTFFISLLSYYVLTALYSFKLKEIVLIDIFTLATLYTSRIIAGGFALQIVLSNWLLIFSFFIFMSLAILKRYIEADLESLNYMDGKKYIAKGRGYLVSDLMPLLVIGISSGLISILIFIFYITDPYVISQYSSPNYLWIAAIILTYWISNLWLVASRNEINEDPISFALKQKNSLAAIMLIALLFLAAILI